MHGDAILFLPSLISPVLVSPLALVSRYAGAREITNNKNHYYNRRPR